MIDARALTAAEFLNLRHRLIDDHNVTILSKLNEQLETIAENDPDRAAELFQALADSEHPDDRSTAAIYADCLLTTHPDLTKTLLATLLQDTNKAVRTKAFDTLETITEEHTISTQEAARLTHLLRECARLTLCYTVFSVARAPTGGRATTRSRLLTPIANGLIDSLGVILPHDPDPMKTSNCRTNPRESL